MFDHHETDYINAYHARARDMIAERGEVNTTDMRISCASMVIGMLIMLWAMLSLTACR